MPKRGAFKGSRNWNQNNGQRFNGAKYDEHDDRDRRPGGDLTIRKDSNRRVSFKTSGGNQGRFNNSKQRSVAAKFEEGIRARLEEDDEMAESANKSGFRNADRRIRRRGSPIPKSARLGNSKTKSIVEGASGWFQVVIPYGQKYSKEFILKSLLQAMSPEIFIPHYWKVESTCISFYVDDIKMAKALANCDRTIELPDGFKLILKIRNSVPPVQLDAKVREQMKLAMVKRYSPATKALDLTKFHSDEDLREIFCALFRPTIMLAALDIIAENIPDLEALNLDNNKIHSMDHFKFLATKLPNLKILHLGNNRITSPNSLDSLKQCNIIDMVLKGNPLRDRYRDETVYVSEIRKRFPKLQKLDGVDLPPLIGFDIETEDSKLPTPKASFLSNQAGADIVRQFLEQYFIIFDSENRQPLLDAYHEHAMFSLTSTFTPNPQHRLVKFLPHNRNLKRVRALDDKIMLLKNGRLPVVSFLSELPLTEHDPQSFAVDLTIFTPSLILLTVTGVFREKLNNALSSRSSQNDNLLRSFHRSLVIVPAGSGFCIKNDMLHVNTLTMAQARTAFRASTSTQAQQPNTTSTITAPVQQQPSIGMPSNTVNTTPDDATKMQMVQAMSQLSQMNLEWSKKCLEETSWDFDRAGFVFTELHKQNKIPPEAFVKP